MTVKRRLLWIATLNFVLLMSMIGVDLNGYVKPSILYPLGFLAMITADILYFIFRREGAPNQKFHRSNLFFTLGGIYGIAALRSLYSAMRGGVPVRYSVLIVIPVLLAVAFVRTGLRSRAADMTKHEVSQVGS